MSSSALRRVLDLVSEHRIRQASAGSRGILIASESDKGRVLNSASFRRLQQKAQVFPLDINAAVRTRLTHSIEVSQIGRYLAQKVIEKLQGSGGTYVELAAFVNVVETACLLHDIGNPPFGHLGEAAIREFFAREDKEAPPTSDLEDFDGNPQGFRLISFLSGKDRYGLNLTSSLLLSTLKYPWTLKGKPKDAKKSGVFDMDWSTYEQTCAALSWLPGKKYPFVKLMEAADDIAYSLSDLEDGLEKEIIRIEDLKKEFGHDRFSLSNVYPIVSFKTSVTNEAVEVAANSFIENLPDILAGEDVKLLPKESGIGAMLSNINNYARKYIYQSSAAERVELAGRSVIAGLLRHFKQVLELEEDQFVGILEEDRNYIRGCEFEARLVRRLPIAYREKYGLKDRGAEADRRAHLIVDFVAGMTDDFALETYQMFEGIRIR